MSRALDIVARIVSERPAFHEVDGEPQVWHASPRTLELIARHVSEGDVTLETGSGASTVVFCAAGAAHTAISPHAGEHERIRAFCREAGLDDAALECIAGRSDDVLPGLSLARPLDVAMVDGKHSFPHPVVDCHYVGARVRVGGVLIVDDAPIPAVAVALRGMLSSGEWELIELADDRAAALRKLREPAAGDDWAAQPFNRGFPEHSFMPAPERLRLWARSRGRRLRAGIGRRIPALRRIRGR